MNIYICFRKIQKETVLRPRPQISNYFQNELLYIFLNLCIAICNKTTDVYFCTFYFVWSTKTTTLIASIYLLHSVNNKKFCLGFKLFSYNWFIYSIYIYFRHFACLFIWYITRLEHFRVICHSVLVTYFWLSCYFFVYNFTCS